MLAVGARMLCAGAGVPRMFVVGARMLAWDDLAMDRTEHCVSRSVSRWVRGSSFWSIKFANWKSKLAAAVVVGSWVVVSGAFLLWTIVLGGTETLDGGVVGGRLCTLRSLAVERVRVIGPAEVAEDWRVSAGATSGAGLIAGGVEPRTNVKLEGSLSISCAVGGGFSVLLFFDRLDRSVAKVG
jgi:hypothetical protein